MPKVSVIVPVYGVEKYMERCARSLFEQTLDDIEYLFIDDCTPDRSMEILQQVLEEYPQRKPQVTIHRMGQNSGQAAVRKWGMQNATGEYVIHCDGDDWVESDMYWAMYEKAKEEDADMVVCDYETNNEDGATLVKQGCNPNALDSTSIIVDLLCGRYMGSLCNRMIKRTVYQDNEIIYPTKNFAEDLTINIQIAYYVQKTIYIPNAYYHYTYNPCSITQKGDEEAIRNRFTQFCANVRLMETFYQDKQGDNKMYRAIECRKFKTRDRLLPLTDDKYYYRLWRSTFPEINKHILWNDLISFKMKIRYVISLCGLYPLCKRLISGIRN